MKKFWIFLICAIIVFLGAFFYFRNYNRVNENQQKSIIDEKEIVDNRNESVNETIKVNSTNIVISPNCTITMQKVYLKCNHTLEEKIIVPDEVVNMNLEELKLYYNDWKVEKFSPTEVVLSKTFSDSCNQHYILKTKDDFLTIYRENDNGELEEIEQTEIFVDFLPEQDKESLQNGIKAVGKSELNAILEDYE